MPAFIAPDPGLFLWTVLLFLVFFFILARFAWKPIVNALHDREKSIEDSLQQAVLAKEEMAKLKSENEALLKEAQKEREKILKDANRMKDQIISDAKKAAQEEGAKEREKAKQQIDAEKNAALAEIKNTAATLAVEVAERILRKEFDDKGQQENFAQQLITELNQN
ncbi:MAG: F0F1 ATP synthase subunit B [Bacteroidota bacterium]